MGGTKTGGQLDGDCQSEVKCNGDIYYTFILVLSGPGSKVALVICPDDLTLVRSGQLYSPQFWLSEWFGTDPGRPWKTKEFTESSNVKDSEGNCFPACVFAPWLIRTQLTMSPTLWLDGIRLLFATQNPSNPCSLAK